MTPDFKALQVEKAIASIKRGDPVFMLADLLHDCLAALQLAQQVQRSYEIAFISEKNANELAQELNASKAENASLQAQLAECRKQWEADIARTGQENASLEGQIADLKASITQHFQEEHQQLAAKERESKP